MKTWQVIDAIVNTPAREAAEYGLMEAGARGTETIDKANGRVNVSGYFEGTVAVETSRATICEALRIYGFEPSALQEVRIREIADEDWLGEWKKHWRPVEVGRFIIAPPWSVVPGPTDRIIVKINPGMAFGTGTHETTRLCLKAIEKYFAAASFLDIGTGAGILAIAAAKLAPAARVIACDTDAQAIEIARQNAQLNQVDSGIEFRVGSIDDRMPSADFVCANLTAPMIVELLPSLLGLTCGRLILSGILDSQFAMVHGRLLELAATVDEIIQDNEWLALVI